MTRFNSPEYVKAWQATGAWPGIHRDMCEAILETPPAETTVLDLCCSTGLLGRWVMDHFDVPVLGMDSDERALDLGMTAGVFTANYAPIRQVISLNALPVIREFLEAFGVEYVLARRCLMELGSALPLEYLSHTLAEAGVLTIIMEGHVASNRSVNPLVTADAQCAGLVDYEVVKKRANTRTLNLK